MRKLLLLFLIVVAQAQVTTTPNIQLQLPPHGFPNYDVVLNNNFSVIDTAIGVLQNAFQGAWINSTTYLKGQQVTYLGSVYVSLSNSNFNNVPATSPAVWQLVFSSSGTVSSVSDLTGLFTTATRTTTPTFSLVTQTANTIFAGPTSGGVTTPTFRSLVPADLPASITSSTSGNAATATSLAATPAKCTAGNYPLGVDALGNALNCTAATGSGPANFNAVSHQFLTSFSTGTNTFSAAQPAFTDISGTATTGQLPAGVVYNNQTNTYTAGMKQLFGASATTAGLGFGGVTADPSGLSNGDAWFRSDTGRLRFQAAGVSQSFAFVADLPATSSAVTSQWISSYNAATGAFTKSQPAPGDISGFGSAGNFIRSTGSAWGASTIQAADVPTLNQNTTGKATGNIQNFGCGPIAGNLTQTNASMICETRIPIAATVVTYTLSLTQAPAGCTTFPTYQLWDFTSSTALNTITLVNSTAYYQNTGLSAALVATHDIGIREAVTGNCTTQPANGYFSIWYTM